MKFRAYNEKNISTGDIMTGHIFATYFRTKKEAIAYAKQIGGNAKVEKGIGGQWIECAKV